ncbi:unnamed protein product [Phytomonas sp. Hart1]|nr:unnamed protein product [Phytomonas sp. Hart1]|eukprot:CCW71670.1 unnamed protein product [Phytomonas sp. isolate Hart1]
MDLCQDLFNELDATLNNLHNCARGVIEAETLPEKKKQEMIARPFVREARSLLSALRAEARRSDDEQARSNCEAMCRIREERVRNCEKEMREQIFPTRTASRPKTFQEQREEELLGEGGPDGSGFTSSKSVLKTALNIQKDALESIQRSEQLQHQTEETGRGVMHTLQKQTLQMYQVDEELRDINGPLNRASRDLRWFYRQLSVDKCFLVLLGFLVFVMLGLVFVSIYMKRKRNKNNLHQ